MTLWFRTSIRIPLRSKLDAEPEVVKRIQKQPWKTDGRCRLRAEASKPCAEFLPDAPRMV